MTVVNTQTVSVLRFKASATSDLAADRTATRRTIPSDGLSLGDFLEASRSGVLTTDLKNKRYHVARLACFNIDE